MDGFGQIVFRIGILIVVTGLLVMLFARSGLPLGRLPGDFAVRGRYFSIYAPVASCLLLSLLISLILWLVGQLRR